MINFTGQLQVKISRSHSPNILMERKRNIMDTHRSFYNIYGSHLTIMSIADACRRLFVKGAADGSEPTELTAIHIGGRRAKMNG